MSQLLGLVSQLHGVGPAVTQRLSKLKLNQIVDLLFYFPKRHDDFSIITPIGNCTLSDPVTICAVIESIRKKTSWKRQRFSLTEAKLSDDSGSIKVIWFNQPYIAEQLSKGDKVYLSGSLVDDKYGLHMNNPMYEKYKTETTHTARIVPIYPSTYGLTQKQLRYFIKQALNLLISEDEEALPDWLPDSIRDQYNLLSLTGAIQKIHFPDDANDIESAKYRLAFDELLIVQLFVQSTKQLLAREQAIAITCNEAAIQDFVNTLPFQLTPAQKQAAWEIIKDSAHTKPMNRLLEGDVGSGKTIVATIAMLNTALQGCQAVLMAPTAILAKQHYETIRLLLKNTNIIVGLITSDLKELSTGETSNSIETAADIVVGTHSLIQDNINFRKLALAIVDEQHRFGVSHRRTLKYQSGDISTIPHLLSMTATPIPRSLALTIYSDLDLSILGDMPPGRKPIHTEYIATKDERIKMYKLFFDRLARKEQIYIIAPRIEEADNDDETSPLISVSQLHTKIKKLFKDYRVEQLHGKLSSTEKDTIMKEFNNGVIDILIATTVVEVGVDVPNATIMVIENADRFGLAQLHQLRGRVGRSTTQSYCFVCSDTTNIRTQERLSYFKSTTDGFKLAEYDLQLRGPGDVYGQDQSGFLNHFKIAKITDRKLVKQTQETAVALFKEIDQYSAVRTRLDQFIKRVHLE